MVVVEAVALVVVVDIVADVDTDDGQSKRLRGDDANNDDNGGSKKEPDKDRERLLLDRVASE